jgi:hypothetical protein
MGADGGRWTLALGRRSARMAQKGSGAERVVDGSRLQCGSHRHGGRGQGWLEVAGDEGAHGG